MGGLPTVYYLASDAKMICIEEVCQASSLELYRLKRADELMAFDSLVRPCCIVLETSVQAQPEVQVLLRHFAEQAIRPSIILVSENPSIGFTVAAMEQGVMTVLQSPVTKETLEKYIRFGLTSDASRAVQDEKYKQISERLGKLTSRQRQVLDLVVSGVPTRAIATQLGISQRLVEKERSAILRTFDSVSTPDVTLLIGSFRVLEELFFRNKT